MGSVREGVTTTWEKEDYVDKRSEADLGILGHWTFRSFSTRHPDVNFLKSV